MPRAVNLRSPVARGDRAARRIGAGRLPVHDRRGDTPSATAVSTSNPGTPRPLRGHQGRAARRACSRAAAGMPPHARITAGQSSSGTRRPTVPAAVPPAGSPPGGRAPPPSAPPARTGARAPARRVIQERVAPSGVGKAATGWSRSRPSMASAASAPGGQAQPGRRPCRGCQRRRPRGCRRSPHRCSRANDRHGLPSHGW
jgi:hypothetical protein